tara:strand:- start:385 stop:1131 length:747 start_codon:yes stop_codon:yes gene_type:complete
MKIIRKILNQNKVYLFNYNYNSFFEGLYRLLAIVISPIFIKINPNTISFFSLICGFFALIISLIFSIKIKYIIALFVLSFVLDFTDGLIARYNLKSSFYGRFIDGLFDIFVLGFLHITLLVYLINFYSLETSSYKFIFYITTIFVLPIQHLILDRFSALARWCNEISKSKKIKPYHRNLFFNKITMLLFDIQHLLLFYIIFFDENNFLYITDLFFIVSFSASSFSIVLYFYLSKKKLSLIKNQKDNRE